ALSVVALSSIERSRQLILEAVGSPTDLALVLCGKRVAQQFTAAGARALLIEHGYRELDLEGLASARRDTALLPSAGFCRSDRDAMPRALAIAGLRFDRVVVLPSSFDPSEEFVHRALSRTRGIVFAAEPESYRRIADLCDARLAHETSFFFDFSP